MGDWKQAAKLALRTQQVDGVSDASAGRVERASLDVHLGRQQEIVSMRLHDQRLVWSCTCGESSCAHVSVALRFAAGLSGGASELHDSSSGTSLAPRRLSRPNMQLDLRQITTASGERSAPVERGERERSDRFELGARGAVAETLEDLVTAIARAGTGPSSGSSVQETIDRLVHVAEAATRTGVSRFVGRVRQALATGDVPLLAHMLSAAGTLAADLRAHTPSADARARLSSWLGADPADEDGGTRISDRVLVEVAREWLSGYERAQIERRYLVDLESGEVYREERMRRGRTLSVGSCPRVLEAGLAEIAAGFGPRSIRLLQYTTSPEVDKASWDKLGGLALRDFTAIAALYQAELLRSNGLVEPFAVVAPQELAREAQLALVDGHGRLLPLGSGDEEGSALRRFEELTTERVPLWVAGRLFDRDGTLMLAPLSAAILKGETLCHERL